MQDGIIKAVIGATEFDLEFRDGTLIVDGEPVEASLVRVGPSAYSLLVNGKSYELTIQTNGKRTFVTESGVRADVRLMDRVSILLAALEGSAKGKKHTLEIRAPMPGLVLAIEIEPGATVASGQGVIVLEAMKMENEIFSSGAGIVEKIHVSTSEAVTKGQILVTLVDALPEDQ